MPAGDKPNTGAYGFNPAIVTYVSPSFVSGFDIQTPSESGVRQLAISAAETNRPVAMNIEHFGIDARGNDEGTVALERTTTEVPDRIGELVPFGAGGRFDWRVAG
jgi:hypothetical protein